MLFLFSPTGSNISFILQKYNYYCVGVVIYDDVTVHYCDVVVNYTDGAVVCLLSLKEYATSCGAFYFCLTSSMRLSYTLKPTYEQCPYIVASRCIFTVGQH